MSLSASPRNRGFTYLELIIATMILAILAAAIIPVAEVTSKRQKEIELRRALRTVRIAIDDYKRAGDLGLVGGVDDQLGSEGYPEKLEILVEGVEQVGSASSQKMKFLRRVPVDPMTGEEWGMRSYQDDPDSSFWGGQNVYDIFTKSSATALDGTKYADW